MRPNQERTTKSGCEMRNGRQITQRNPKATTVTEDQVAMVLMAVASLESWDGHRPSIALDSAGGWTLKRVNDMRMPCPSDKLLNIIKGLSS
jgi:hypothetical protein